MIFKRIICSSIVLYVVSLCFVASGVGGELRPYRLPSQQRPPIYEQAPESSQRTETVDESFYRDFEEKVKNMKAENKVKLKEAFAGKRDEAIKNGRTAEAKHYVRLLEILKKY